MTVERLDFSKPPPGVDLDALLQSAVMTVRTAGVWGPIALAAAWAHYKGRHDPPGMWSGYNATKMKPVVTDFRPRMGVAMMECHCDGGPFASAEEAHALGRAAAWAWYERRNALAQRLSTGPFAPLPCRCPAPTSDWGGHGANLCQHDGDYLRVLSIDWWPRCLAWSDADCDAVERWLAEGGEVPEVLR